MIVTTKRFETEGRPGLAYDDLGDPAARPVVLLHGGGAGTRRSWNDIPERLAPSYRVLAMDMRGHGESGRTPGEYAIQHYASDVEAFIELVAGGPAVLVGHSWGGVVAAQVAGTRPDLVDGAFFEDPPLHWTKFSRARSTRGSRPFRLDDFREKVRGLIDAGATGVELSSAALQEFAETGEFFAPRQHVWLAQRKVGATVDEMADAFRQTPTPAGGVVGDRIDEHTARGIVSGLLDNDPEVFAPGEDALDAYDPKRPMKCPVYVLRADPATGPPPIGGAFPPDFEEPFLATHPHATVEFVPGAGHGVHVQMPELFIDRLERFLGGLHD